MMKFLPLLFAFSACAWDPPINPNPLSAEPLANGVQGTVVFAGIGDVSNVFITVFRSDNPGPPYGTGSPVTFATVPASAFTGDGAGLQSASFVVSHLPDGDYFFNALLDSDKDFNPFVSGLAGATCGDWVGSHLTDLISGQPAAVHVEGGQLREAVTIMIGAPITTERPAFTTVGEISLSRKKGKDSTFEDGSPDPSNTQVYELTSVGVATAYGPSTPLSLTGPCASALADCGTDSVCLCEPESNPCDTSFQVYLVDSDHDGVVDPYPSELQAAAGLKDVWPRVYVEFIGELGTFEFEGQQKPERWVGENYPLAFDLAVGDTLGQTPEDWIGVPVGIPVAANRLAVTFSPAFRHYHAGGSFAVDANGPYDLVDLRRPEVSILEVPKGAWKLTVISHTGQTWTMPNEIAALGLPSLSAEFDVASQGLAVIID